MKVYTQHRPQIVMEGSKGFAHFAGELLAVENNGLIDIIRPIHGNDPIEVGKAHTEFTDGEGNSFGNLQETIDGLNELFNTESDICDTDVYIVALGLGYTGTRKEWEKLYKKGLGKLVFSNLL